MNLERMIGSVDHLRAFVTEIYFIVQNFPFHIAASIANCRDEQFFLLMADNLYVETGAGFGKHHIAVYRDLLKALDLDVLRLKDDEVWQSTRRLECTCGRLYASWDMGEKLGALYAFETMSGPMVTYWDKALRNTGVVAEPAFRFFTMHKDIEIRHSHELEPLIERYAASANFRKRFGHSALEVMASLESWWDDMLNLTKQCASTVRATRGSAVNQLFA